MPPSLGYYLRHKAGRLCQAKRQQSVGQVGARKAPQFTFQLKCVLSHSLNVKEEINGKKNLVTLAAIDKLALK